MYKKFVHSCKSSTEATIKTYSTSTKAQLESQHNSPGCNRN